MLEKNSLGWKRLEINPEGNQIPAHGRSNQWRRRKRKKHSKFESANICYIKWRRWEDNIQMDLQNVGGGRGNWMELAEDRDRWRAFVGTVRDFRVP